MFSRAKNGTLLPELEKLQCMFSVMKFKSTSH